MKLAFCLFNYFPYGGLQRDFLRIAQACADKGFEIHVYTMEWEGEQQPNFHVHLIAAKGTQNHTRIQSYVKQLQAILATENFNAVIGFNKMPGLDIYYAADVCYQARVRAQRPAIYRYFPRYKKFLALEKAVFASQQKTKILMISSQQQKEFMHYYQTESERFHLLPPGIQKDRIASANAMQLREKLRNDWQLTEKDKLLLMVGSGFKTKGLDRSLLALAALPKEYRDHCHLFVIGQDNPANFQNLAKRLKIADRVRFLGGRNDVPLFLLGADLLLHPSYHENTGTAILEALVAGLPVLTIDICGYAHYVKKAQAGFVLASPFEQSSFNKTLFNILLSNQQEWRTNALAFARTADIYHLPEKAADFIEQQINERKQ